MDPSLHGSETPKESVTKRYKLAWRALLISNLALGAYMFVKARKKNIDMNDTEGPTVEKEGTKPTSESPAAPSETSSVSEEPTIPPVVMQPVRVREPIPDDLQRELFKWMLEEKRKIKPKDSAEKKRIDEDKAILKQFIRAKTIPKFLTDDSVRS